VSGSSGTSGAVGSVGPSGPPGPLGSPGASGSSGTSGARGASDWTPVFTGGVAYGSDSTTYIKSSGTNGGWDGQVYSTQGYTNGVYATARATSTSQYVMWGLNNDPTTNGSYETINYAWYLLADGLGTLQIYENGGNVGNFGTYTTSTVLAITYDGTSLIYWKDGVAQRTITVSITTPLFFDSSFYYSNSQGITNVGFGPMGPRGAVGTGGPAGPPGPNGPPGIISGVNKILFGVIAIANSNSGTVTFSSAFSSTPVVVLTGLDQYYRYTFGVSLVTISNTGFVWATNLNYGENITWIAIN
jgi:hypothetical protein